jgi:hypothetical protein
MTAFNNISAYFKVNSGGATFGDTSTGAYTKVSSAGLEHVDSTGSTPYFYISYVSVGVATVPQGSIETYLTIDFPTDLITKLNGKVPNAIASLRLVNPAGVSAMNGVEVSQITSTNLTIHVTCSSYQSSPYIAHAGGTISFTYLIIGKRWLK